MIQDIEGLLPPGSDGRLTMSAVPNAQIENVWLWLEGELAQKPNLAERGFVPEFFLQELLAGRLRLWLVGNDKEIYLSLMTRVIVYPLWNVLEVFWGRGERFAEALPFVVAGLEDFCRAHECTKVQVLGRKGWERALAPLGFKFSWGVYELDVSLRVLH